VTRVRVPIVALMIVTLLGPACASPDLVPIGAAGVTFAPDADERALWTAAEKEEAALAARTRRYDDPVLEEYLARLLAGVVPDTVRAAGPPLTLVVVRDPTLNAFAMPNGTIYVHTGLLSRLENEAQVATILARELTHLVHRHALARERDRTRPPALPPAARALVLGPTASAIVGLGLPLAAVAAIDGYGRAREREADAGAVDGLVRAGYDPEAAPRAFERLRADASDRGALETFLLGSPGFLSERLQTTRRLARDRRAAAAALRGAVGDSDVFELRMRPLVRENANEDVRAGRFTIAQRQLDRVLAATPGDAMAHLYYGELRRLMSQRARDAAVARQSLALAEASYDKAAELDPSLAEPHRQLGFLYYQRRDYARASAAFTRYLELRPDAPDAERIKAYLTELARP
jgi:predicted Zn-dependent protease